MNREQLLERLAYFLNADNGIGAAVYFVLENGGESTIRFADIEDHAKNELKMRFLEVLPCASANFSSQKSWLRFLYNPAFSVTMSLKNSLRE